MGSDDQAPPAGSEKGSVATIRLGDAAQEVGSVVRTIGLADEAAAIGNVSPAERAAVFGVYADTWLRLILGGVIAALFLYLNSQVIGFVETAFAADIKELAANPPQIKPADRLITPAVVMSLVGATVVQVGVAIVAIISYLFPKKDQPSK